MENIVRKGEIACYKQLFLFSQCFLRYMALICYFKYTLKCHLQSVSVWTSLKFCGLVNGLTTQLLHIYPFPDNPEPLDEIYSTECESKYLETLREKLCLQHHFIFHHDVF